LSTGITKAKYKKVQLVIIDLIYIVCSHNWLKSVAPRNEIWAEKSFGLRWLKTVCRTFQDTNFDGSLITTLYKLMLQRRHDVTIATVSPAKDNLNFST